MSLETVIATIEGDLQTGLKDMEADAEADVLNVWNFCKGTVLAILPTVGQDVLALAEAAVTKAMAGGSNEIGDIVQTMLEMVEGDGVNILEGLGEDVLNVIASMAKGKVAPTPAAAA